MSCMVFRAYPLPLPRIAACGRTAIAAVSVLAFDCGGLLGDTAASTRHGDDARSHELFDTIAAQHLVNRLDLVFRTRNLNDERIRRYVDDVGAEDAGNFDD